MEAWQPTPLFLPGESPWTEESGGLYSPWGCKESGTTERLSTAQDSFIVTWLETRKLQKLVEKIFHSFSDFLQELNSSHLFTPQVQTYSPHEALLPRTEGGNRKHVGEE